MRIFASNLNDRPHFMFSCVPHKEQAVYYDLEECFEIVKRCAITSSAVTFPDVDVRLISPGEVNAYLEYSNVDIARTDVLEEWRCYRNGEFRYRSNFWELGDADTQQRIRQKTIYTRNLESEPLGFMNLVGLAYRVTAAHVFAERLLREFSATVEEVKSALDGVAGYGIGRIDMSQHFAQVPLAQGNDCVFRSTPEEVQRAFDPYAMSAETLMYFCRHFGWETTRATFDEWLEDVREVVERS